MVFKVFKCGSVEYIGTEPCGITTHFPTLDTLLYLDFAVIFNSTVIIILLTAVQIFII